jgi:hypothetical protein
MRRKMLLVVALCMTTVSTAALAGEVNGSTKNPKEDYSRGLSFCKFSGLNDDPLGEDPTQGPPGRVQSFGQDVRSGAIDPRDFNPGFACNPNSNPLPPELLNRP